MVWLTSCESAESLLTSSPVLFRSKKEIRWRMMAAYSRLRSRAGRGLVRLKHRTIAAVGHGEELIVAALLDEPAALHHRDLVAPTHRRQTVRDH